MRKLIVLSVASSLLAADVSAQAVSASPLGGGVAQMLLGLAGVLAMLGGSLWLLRKLATQRGAAAGLMRVVAATAVGGRERVVIVEIGSTWLVLGVAPGRVSVLAEIPRQPLPETPPGSGAGAVQHLLQRLRQGR